VPSGKVGYYNDWDESERKFHKMPIMSYEQLRQLPEKVVEIGSHGISHIALDQLSFDGVTKEIVESRLEIEQNVGKPVRFFAFPFGRYLNSYRNNKNLIVSYNAACTSWWGRYNSPKDIYTLRRIGIWESDSFEDFVDKLEGYYDWLAAKEKINRFYKFITSLPRL
jgi:peptidoglycan/xylan/chitin deacetylase (PgdA/CDA1 family)